MNTTTNYFDQIAGYNSEKKMMEDLANLIKNRDKLKAMGGRLPKGLLLIGENGLGKTVLANAFMKTSGVYNVRLDCSSFDADSFKDLVESKFQEASTNAPSIIFIDELDKVAGSSRAFDTGDNFQHFKDLLNTLNKYGKEEGIFILACANPSFEIEKSLVRSGRIDRTIRLDLPTQSERVAIFSHFLKGKKISDDINVDHLSKMTAKLTGADIEVIVNEATIKAFNDNRDILISKDIEQAVSDKRFGPLEKESEFDGTNLKIIATHEAGHAVAAMVLTGKVLNRLTVARRGDVAGYAETLLNEEQVVSLKDKFNKVVVALAGREAEKLFYNTYFAGAISDIYLAQHVIATLVTSEGAYGYDKLILTPTDRMFWPNQLVNRQPSNEKLKKIEDFETRLFKAASEQAHNILVEHKELAKELVDRLVVEKTLTKEDLDKIFQDYFQKDAIKENEGNKKYIYNSEGYDNVTYAIKID